MLLPPVFPSVLQLVVINSVRNMWICVCDCVHMHVHALALALVHTHHQERGFFPIGLELIFFLFSPNFA